MRPEAFQQRTQCPYGVLKTGGMGIFLVTGGHVGLPSVKCVRRSMFNFHSAINSRGHYPWLILKLATKTY
jgi:hypothetical protein